MVPPVPRKRAGKITGIAIGIRVVKLLTDDPDVIRPRAPWCATLRMSTAVETTSSKVSTNLKTLKLSLAELIQQIVLCTLSSVGSNSTI